MLRSIAVGVFISIVAATTVSSQESRSFAGTHFAGQYDLRIDTCREGQCREGEEGLFRFSYYVSPDMRVERREGGKTTRLYEMGVAHVFGRNADRWDKVGDDLVRTVTYDDSGTRTTYRRLGDGCTVSVETLPHSLASMYVPALRMIACRVRPES